MVYFAGAGGYADNEVGGVSCTGHGESIFKVVLAHQITTLMKQGEHDQVTQLLENLRCMRL